MGLLGILWICSRNGSDWTMKEETNGNVSEVRRMGGYHDGLNAVMANCRTMGWEPWPGREGGVFGEGRD